MSKRKITDSNGEDAKDQDHQDRDASGSEWRHSSSVDDDDERVPVRPRRVILPRITVTTSEPQRQESGEAQSGMSDGEGDASSDDNTSAAPLQRTAGTPRVSNKGSKVSKRVQSGRERICGRTKCCGVVSPRIKEPRKAQRSNGDFFCVICGSQFTRAAGVNYHFIGCVAKYGNPHGNKWNDHPSCGGSKKGDEDDLDPDSDSDNGPPPPKKQRVDKMPRPQPVPEPTALPEGSRATGPLGSGALPTGPRRSRAAQPSAPVAETRTPVTAPTKKQNTTKKSSNVVRKTASRNVKKDYIHRMFLDGSLSPLSNLNDIFHDMVNNAWSKIALPEALSFLSDKEINVATMCSGTESPLLALGKIQHDLRDSRQMALNFKHLFSAEIVPSKQAYIERNFGPDKLFRDIREMAEGRRATTAYGALADVPSDVDILVAGFSCVDFSNLNKHSKKLTDVGESGDTFRAILGYARKYRPAIIILENVDGAPWDLIKAIWENDPESTEKYLNKYKRPKAAKGADTNGEDATVEDATVEDATVEDAASEGAADENASVEDSTGEKASGEDANGKVADDEQVTEEEPGNLWDDDDPGYSAVYHRVDAKQYYIPQTRTRRYMLCLDRRRFSSIESADKAAQDWKRHMVALERKASVSVEAFLLPEDDPRLQRAKDEMSKTWKGKREVNWEICRARYDAYRDEMKLGISRTILNWVNDGAAKAPSYMWTDWTAAQVERVWDTVEICHLRSASRGYDPFFKSRFWELSQNIDRFKDDTPAGIIGCLTPQGQPFSSFRGGPITGLEAVALQGLPIDLLVLTRESQKELYDLAGNAMTSTVVGAALLSALTVGHKLFTRTKEPGSRQPQDQGSNFGNMRYSELRQKQVLDFAGSVDSSLEELCKMAKESIRLCHCEGQSLKAPALIRVCERCHHHCCEKCGDLPKHNYTLLGGNGDPQRTEAQDFRKLVAHAVPTRLQLVGLTSEQLEELAQPYTDRPKRDWRLFTEAILQAFKQEYRYESAKRSHCWRVTYNATHSRLEMVFDQEEVYWLLYGKPDDSEPANSRMRELLNLPLARLTVRGNNMRREPITVDNMLEGSWEIRLPIPHTFPIAITGQGELTDSWEKKLGLQGEKFIDRKVYTSLHIARNSGSAAELGLDHEICGDYDLLENCSTACSSLHKKRPTADGLSTRSLYLFLDPDRIGPPGNDCYVFSTEKHRLEYAENRYLVAKVESKWRPPSEGSHLQKDSNTLSEARCTVSGRWEPCPIFLQSHKGLEEASLRFPRDEISMPAFHQSQHPSRVVVGDIYGCLDPTATTALLSCEIPGQLVDSVGWQVGRWTIIDQKSDSQVAAEFAWLFARVKDLGDFEGKWRSLGSRPSGYQRCLTCAPDLPKIRWTCSRNGIKIVPYEDGREAGEFERKIKARPAPFLLQTYVNDDENRTGRLLVGIHLPTLVHRALAALGSIADSDDIQIEWCLDTRFEAPTRYKLRGFTLTSNKLMFESGYNFPTGETLRPEQRRSLQWMIGQEADDITFYEEEIEEATLSQLSWRAEVRVRRNRIIRGGILADEVGYGKTATTLALIHKQVKSAEKYAGKPTPGCISVKATLVLVPAHLVHQWTGQALKFLGIDVNDDRLLVITDVTDLAKVSVRQMKKAVIILVSWKVLSSPVYMTRMSHFAALPPGPSSGERETEAWLTRACGNIEKHIGEIISEHMSPKDFAAILQRRLKAAHSDKEILRDIPTQRLKGAKYAAWNPAEISIPEDESLNDENLEKHFKHMTDCDKTDLDSMRSVLLHMFDFYRVVIDEYTYVNDGQQSEILANLIATTKARSRWVLSGTPPLQDFADVQTLAKFLAYNLGVVDDAAGVVKGVTIRRIREHRTSAEQFRAFGYSHTARWHESRQAHAQRFLDKYASKNVAEIGVIESVLHLRPHFLTAAETVLNAELQQQLQSTDMRIVLLGKGKYDKERLRRFTDLLKGCKTASECLLKSCSNFDLGDTSADEKALSGDAMDVDGDRDEASFGACEKLITVREQQMTDLVAELQSNLLHAAWLEQHCGRATNPEHQGSHYRQWKSEIERNGLRDPTATSELLEYLAAAFESVDDQTEDIYYRDPLTDKELKAEKKAAEERKKRQKAKKTAAKKSKKSKKAKKANESEDLESDDGPDPPKPKPDKIQNDNFAEYARVLRNLTGHLRSLVTELTARTRSLRFARGAQQLYQWYLDLSESPTCDACGKSASNYDNISINIRCGHTTCEKCMRKKGIAICAVGGCREGTESFRLKKAADLVGAGKTTRYGARAGNIVTLIESIPEDEQVLVFVQFEQVMINLSSALEAASISHHALTHKAHGKMIEMMNDFQDNDGEDKRKVLLLNPSNETAAGINLTNANHIIFVSPLLTDSQQSYDASMTQCIGRAKRYGQRKTVHVYRFLSLRTIDVDILEEREQKTLVKKKTERSKKASKKGKAADLSGRGTRGTGASNEEWLLVEETEIDDTMETGWGSGYNFKSNPLEDEDF